MKLIFLFLLLPFLAFGANPTTYRIDTASTNLAATFPAGPQIALDNAVAGIQVSNGSASEIEVNCTSLTKPTVLSATSIFVPGTTSYMSPQGWYSSIQYPFGKYCWMRSVTGTISSGVIQIVAWGY